VSGVWLASSVIFGFMLAEARVSWRNERVLRRRGAIEPPGDVYRAMAVLYPASFVLMGLEGLWRASRVDAAAAVTSYAPVWAASGVVLFAASKALKAWAIRSLGDRWSFRVLIEPGRPRVTTGPYRYVAHPNYVAVVGELASAAMMVGAWIAGPVMLAVFGAVLWMRMTFEERALQAAVRVTSDERQA
jgi:methyltransferase